MELQKLMTALVADLAEQLKPTVAEMVRECLKETPHGSPIDMAALASEIDLDSLADEIDLDSLADEFDADKIADKLDINEMIREFFQNETFSIRP
jgi:hypothetical protein